MKKILYMVPAALLLALSGCHSGTHTTHSAADLLNRYFGSAMKQDYKTTYSCYYAPYKEKISEQEYIKHRREASVLQSYKILSVQQKGDTAQAEAFLTFAPSKELHRDKPATVTVKERLVQEDGQWKVRVW